MISEEEQDENTINSWGEFCEYVSSLSEKHKIEQEKYRDTQYELECELSLLNGETAPQKTDPKEDNCSIHFRGHREFSWGLETTLERFIKSNNLSESIKLNRPYVKKESVATLLDFNVYLEYVINTYEEAGSKFRIHHTIEDIKRWDRPDKPNYDWLELDKKMESFGYLVHLRHYGFPSPLLDWSRSAYKAAFFAFQNPSEGEYVSIYALKRNKYGDGIISSKPEIRVQDYYKNNMENIDDARHRFTLQEGDVTVCLIV